MAKDIDFAWGWHCNLAMMALDAGAPRHESNVQAANFMARVFEVDTYHAFADLERKNTK